MKNNEIKYYYEQWREWEIVKKNCIFKVQEYCNNGENVDGLCNIKVCPLLKIYGGGKDEL
ncbi:MAG: hypothetical protein ACTSXF_01365 [Promethearchaeota archaeon]